MKKKLFALCLVAVLAATAVVGGTLAYFTDTDAAENVMTTGKVAITQNEQQFNDEGVLVDFVDGKALMPMVDTREDKEANPVVDGYFDEGMKNVVDKIITVTNDAKADAVNQDAYVRTILAFETATEYKAGSTEVLRDGKAIFETYIGYLTDENVEFKDYTVTVNGVQYVVAVMVYEDALAPQETSAPSLKQFFLSPDAGNEVELLFGEEYTILALSQATQTAGFDTAADALDTAFGKVTADNVTAWLTAAFPVPQA